MDAADHAADQKHQYDVRVKDQHRHGGGDEHNPGEAGSVSDHTLGHGDGHVQHDGGHAGLHAPEHYAHHRVGAELGVEQARRNAQLNGLEQIVSFQCADVFELLPELERRGEQYDVIILDPPAFTKSQNSVKNATRGYREINLRAMKLLKDGGYLASCSCSHFMTYELFTKTIAQAASSAHRRVRQVEFRTQAPDHPILWAADESYYLKFYILQICRNY